MPEAELVVIGAGPAGCAAAIAAREAGLSVAVIDEQVRAGGQVYRAPASGMAEAADADGRAGADLRRALAACGAVHVPDATVWNVAAGFRVDVLHGDGLATWNAAALIVATGTVERVVPFLGWTRPGVIGLAAATILLKSQHMLPGHEIVVAGCGPLLAAVAAKTIANGGKVAAVVDLAGPTDWMRRLPALAGRPDLVARGAAWLARIRTASVPVFFHHTVIAASGTAVEIAPVDAAGRGRDGRTRMFACDRLAVGHGLVPATEVTRLLRLDHRYDRAAGGWIATRDGDMRTSLPRCYLAGDGGGIAGAAAAALQGRLAGLTAAHDLGRLDADRYRAAAGPLRRRLARAERFGAAMAGLMALRPAQVADIPKDCMVCRCEDVTRAEIDAAVDRGATEVNQVKAWTRCGMGPCQGRSCGDVVAELVAARVGGREAAGQFTARPPIRPLATASLTGDFRYDDIPIPKPAPL